jgi:hypothetical protein
LVIEISSIWGRAKVRAAEKINSPVLLVFWLGYGVASMAPYLCHVEDFVIEDRAKMV